MRISGNGNTKSNINGQWIKTAEPLDEGVTPQQQIDNSAPEEEWGAQLGRDQGSQNSDTVDDMINMIDYLNNRTHKDPSGNDEAGKLLWAIRKQLHSLGAMYDKLTVTPEGLRGKVQQFSQEQADRSREQFARMQEKSRSPYGRPQY